MRKGRALRIIGAIISLLGVAGAVIAGLKMPAMLVAVGIRGVEAFGVVSYILIGLGAAGIVGGTVPAIVGAVKKQNDDRLLENKREEAKRSFSEYATDSLNPEKTRARLEQLRKNNPNLSELVDVCLEQMDRIDTYQARQKSLIDANEAIYLEDTIEVLDDSERRMCRNFRNIINCCILVEDGRGGVNDIDYEIVNNSLGDNEEELKTVATLLKYSVAYINNYNRNGVSDRKELDAWLKAMKNSMGGNHEIH